VDLVHYFFFKRKEENEEKGKNSRYWESQNAENRSLVKTPKNTSAC